MVARNEQVYETLVGDVSTTDIAGSSNVVGLRKSSRVSAAVSAPSIPSVAVRTRNRRSSAGAAASSSDV
jgi:hypothetical protein